MKVGLYLIEYTFYFYTFIETCPGSKGIAEGRKPSGHPEGAKTPEGSPTIRWDAVPNEVRDARHTLGRTKRGGNEVRDA